MLVYVYAADLLCEDCGKKCREELTAEGKAPEDPDDEVSYDSDDFPKGPTEEGSSDSPSHCSDCGCFLETELTDVGVDELLSDCERAMRGDREANDVLLQWVDHYEGNDSRVSLSALANTGLTIAEILHEVARLDGEVKRLSAEVEHLQAKLRDS